MRQLGEETIARAEATESVPPLPEDNSDLKRIFKDAFPGWSFIWTNRGRWWATRPTVDREDLSHTDASALDANTPAELWVKLETTSR
ncbi:hypothetical protein E1287_15215 [Actinomadura sp. KC06]|uniref:hypothetical protein n=1 Tax=Actinomadura sp. KC06 TaxID=2530369 RepID=UPI00104887AB|nr:hypothetical protein [Actinomadura sp. KC06]TDD34970.1 hypothetical protein E1287_15215 [Actinomadura sp. KC06]